jgi:hypothetical protein
MSRLAGRGTDQDAVVLFLRNEGEPFFREPAFDLREKLCAVAFPLIVTANLNDDDAVFVDGRALDAVFAKRVQKLLHLLVSAPVGSRQTRYRPGTWRL